MHAFVKWLRATDAKSVFACAAVAFVLASGAWLSRIFMPHGRESAISSGTARPRARENLGILKILELASNEGTNAVENPFGRVPSPHKQPVPPPPPNNTKTPPPNETKTPPPPAAEKSPPARSETVSLTYKGIFVRTDGSILALIEDSKTQKSTFYGSDSDVFGMKLKSISATNIEVIAPNGNVVPLVINSPEVFLEGRHEK